MQQVITPVNVEERQRLGIRAGDTVRVWQKIEERGKTRLQAFEGIVLARKHGSEPGATFTVRRVLDGIGVEKIFPLYSPTIDKIEIVKRSKVRRAKLYYIRDKVAREIRRQMRNARIMGVATVSETEEALRQAQEEQQKAEKASEEAGTTTSSDEAETGTHENKQTSTEEISQADAHTKGPSEDAEAEKKE